MKCLAPVTGLGVLAFGLWAAEQKPPQNVRPGAAPQSDEPTRIQVEVTRVPMLFTVPDKKGRFITDLGRDDFEIFENKKRQEVAEFSSESDLPLRIAVLI